MSMTSLITQDPCENVDSCLAEKLKALANLSEAQAGLLADLERERREVAAGEMIYKAGEPKPDIAAENSLALDPLGAGATPATVGADSLNVDGGETGR